MQAALRAGRQLRSLAARPTQQARQMSSGASIEEEIKEMGKWRMITYLAVPGSVIFAAYTLLNEEGHEHVHDEPTYPYLRIRSKTFPWGDCGLFEECETDGEEAEE